MLSDELIEFIIQEFAEDKEIPRKIYSGLKQIRDGLQELNEHISSKLPLLLETREIDKIKLYADITKYIDNDCENVKKSKNHLAKLVCSPEFNTIAISQKVQRECHELYILDIKTKTCCGKPFKDVYTAVDVFDKDGTMVSTINIWTRYCDICKKHYIYEDMTKSLKSKLGENFININNSISENIKCESDRKLIDVTVIEKGSNCPDCNGELVPKQMNYNAFSDKELNNFRKAYKMFIIECPSCQKIFTTIGTYTNIQKRHKLHKEEFTNINFNLINENIIQKYNQSISEKRQIYIYRGIIKCRSDNHNIENVSAVVKSLSNEEVSINIQHCIECDKYFISETSLLSYEKIYGVLLFNKKPHESMSEYFDEYGRSGKSPLMVHGYTVRMGELTTSQRQNILCSIIGNKWMSKSKVIEYLEIFISTNGESSKNINARQKWIEDLEFIRNYNFENQPFIKGELKWKINSNQNH